MPNIETPRQRRRREHRNCDMMRSAGRRIHDVWRCPHGVIYEGDWTDGQWLFGQRLSPVLTPFRHARAVVALAADA